MNHTERAVMVTPGRSRVQQPETHVGGAEEGRLAETEILPLGSPMRQPAPDQHAVPAMEIECAICFALIVEAAKFPAKGCVHVYCVTCLAKMQAYTPMKPIVCPQCRRCAKQPIPLVRPPPPRPPVTKARKAAIVVCMFVGLVLCFAALAYDIGVFGVPFYGSVVDQPPGTPPESRHNGEMYARGG
jgi:hypothetical protein